MAGNRYLQLDRTNGRNVEKNTPQTSGDTPAAGDIPALSTGGKLDNGLLNAVNTSAGAGDAAKIGVLDSTGRFDVSMMPVGVVPETASITASEALSAGDYVNVWNSTGAKVRKADATTAGKEAHGFVLAAVSNAATATVYFEGTNTQVTGQTAGPVYLSTTAGAGTTTPPTGSGNVQQRIGMAVSTTAVSFDSGPPTVLV